MIVQLTKTFLLSCVYSPTEVCLLSPLFPSPVHCLMLTVRTLFLLQFYNFRVQSS
jgi:hypothetical protein